MPVDQLRAVMKIVIDDITPMGAVRVNRRTIYKPGSPAARYAAYKEELRLKWMAQTKEVLPPRDLAITFHLPMPESWSAKKKIARAGTAHTSRPDVDNILKGVMDSLCREDKYIWDVHIIKLWSPTSGYIVFEW